MSTESYFLNPGDFLSLESNTLKKAVTCPYLKKIGDSSLINEFNRVRYEIEDSGLFNINGHFCTKYKERELIIVIGVDIAVESDSNSFERNSYKVLIYDWENEEILRCFHFDFEPFLTNKKNRINEPKPSIHFQQSGKLDLIQAYCEREIGIKIPDKEIEKQYVDFEKLRLFYSPVCTVLLLNNIFWEFQTDSDFESIINSDSWNSAVKLAEKKLLHNYYKSCFEHLNTAAHERKLLSKLFYDPS